MEEKSIGVNPFTIVLMKETRRCKKRRILNVEESI